MPSILGYGKVGGERPDIVRERERRDGRVWEGVCWEGMDKVKTECKVR